MPTPNYDLMRDYVNRQLISIFGLDNFELIFYGSFVRHQLSIGADADVLLITKQNFSSKIIQKLRDLQANFLKEFNFPLSLDANVMDDYKDLIQSSGHLLKFLSIKNDNVNRQDFWDRFSINISQKNIAGFLLQKCLDVKRMFLFNLINQNPTGRIFKSDYNPQNISSITGYVVENFESLIKHILTDIELGEVSFLPLHEKKAIREKFVKLQKYRSVAAKTSKMIQLLDEIKLAVKKYSNDI